jgi:hypothetical protein
MSVIIKQPADATICSPPTLTHAPLSCLSHAIVPTFVLSLG